MPSVDSMIQEGARGVVSPGRARYKSQAGISNLATLASEFIGGQGRENAWAGRIREATLTTLVSPTTCSKKAARSGHGLAQPLVAESDLGGEGAN